MKLTLAALALFALSLSAQEPKHITVPTETNARAISVTAQSIERDLPHNSIIHLKGNVEIKTPVCVNVGPSNTQYCEGYVVLHADEAELHEDSGQIDARGNVTVTREQKKY